MTAIAAAPFVRVLHQGDHGPDVEADKRALVKWNHGQKNGVTITPTMGAQAVALVEKFQHAQGLTADGIIGPNTFARMAALELFDADGIRLLKKEQAALAIAAAPHNRFLQIADLTIVHANLLGYSEAIGEQPGERDWFRVAPIDTTGQNWAAVVAQHGKLTSDCSGHYYGCAWHAGIQIPNPDGATGALLELTRTTLTDAQPGDGVIFTGPAYPAGAHITILRAKLAAGDWRVINNGGPTGAGPSYSTLSAQNAWQAAHGAPTQVVIRLPA